MRWTKMPGVTTSYRTFSATAAVAATATSAAEANARILFMLMLLFLRQVAEAKASLGHDGGAPARNVRRTG